MGTQVTLGDLTFNSGSLDSDGIRWQMREIEGWDSPEIRTDLKDKAFQHGLNRGASFYRGRPLILRGLIRCPSLATQRTARRKLAEACDLTDTDGLLSVFESPTKQCAVRRDGRAIIRTVGDRLVEYDIPLLAADPRKYATSESTTTIAGGFTSPIVQAGDSLTPARVVMTPSASVMTVSNPATGVTLQVSNGAAVTVDAMTGTVHLADDSPAWDRMLSSRFLSLAASQLVFVHNGSAQFFWRSAWI